MPQKTNKPEIKGWLRVLYTIFLALLIAFFYGLGVAAFYEGPKEPRYPIEIEKVEPSQLSVEQKKVQVDYDKEMRDFQDKIKSYNRNASLINMALAVVSLVVSFVLANKIFLISDSLLLGGVFTLAYAIILGLSAENPKYSFVVVSIGLLVTVAVGYLRFIRPKLEK